MSPRLLRRPRRRGRPCSPWPPAASPTTAGRATSPTTSASSWPTRRRRRRRRRRSGPKVYFLSQAPNGEDRLQPAGRNVSSTPTAVLTELFNGLTKDEQQ